MTPAEQALRDAALEYHRSPNKGKISVNPTKPLSNQRDLSLAYSPGVAFPCLAIEAEPALASEYTSRGNLVCPRRSKSEPPRRLNIEPGVEADF